MKLFHKIHVYKLLIKASLKKALLNAFYSSLIVFFGILAAQLQNTQQITVITVVTAVLSALVTFLVEFRENYPFYKLLLEYKIEVEDVKKTVKLMSLICKTRVLSSND
jgi:Zn-dependent membrane protease YugP